MDKSKNILIKDVDEIFDDAERSIYDLGRKLMEKYGVGVTEPTDDEIRILQLIGEAHKYIKEARDLTKREVKRNSENYAKLVKIYTQD